MATLSNRSQYPVRVRAALVSSAGSRTRTSRPLPMIDGIIERGPGIESVKWIAPPSADSKGKILEITCA